MEAFFGAVLIALVVGLVFATVFERHRGTEGFLWVFILLLLPLWLVAVWTEPVGPIMWGVAWFELLFIAVMLSLLIAAATPGAYYRRVAPTEKAEEQELRREATGFFWALAVLALIAVVIGYAVGPATIAH